MCLIRLNMGILQNIRALNDGNSIKEFMLKRLTDDSLQQLDKDRCEDLDYLADFVLKMAVKETVRPGSYSSMYKHVFLIPMLHVCSYFRLSRVIYCLYWKLSNRPFSLTITFSIHQLGSKTLSVAQLTADPGSQVQTPAQLHTGYFCGDWTWNHFLSFSPFGWFKYVHKYWLSTCT